MYKWITRWFISGRLASSSLSWCLFWIVGGSPCGCLFDLREAFSLSGWGCDPLYNRNFRFFTVSQDWSVLFFYSLHCFSKAGSSYRGASGELITLSTALQFGAAAAALALRSLAPYLMDIVRGYPFYPDEKEEFTPSVAKEIIGSLVWLAASFLMVAAISHRDGGFRNFNLFRSLTQRNPSSKKLPQNKELNGEKEHGASREIPAPQDSYNMFDPADLPPRLAEYANMVYSACEDLGNFFGFQDSSVRNQAEHLLILLSNNRRYMSSHILPPSVQPPSPIHALHAKVFSNYVKWCRAMGVPPNFSKMNTSMNAPPAVASRVVDLVLYFCTWGEAANIRHMPECVWFLYHKMMEEYIQSEGYTQTRSLYAGHFLDFVVHPIVSVISKVGVSCAFRRGLSFGFLLLLTPFTEHGCIKRSRRKQEL